MFIIRKTNFFIYYIILFIIIGFLGILSYLILMQATNFSLKEIQKPSGNNPRYDGWQLSWIGPIEFKVKYFEQELVIEFYKNNYKASYLFIDHHLFKKKSNLGGCLFYDEKLIKVMNKIAIDIKDNYSSILIGDDEVWNNLFNEIDNINNNENNKLQNALKDIPN